MLRNRKEFLECKDAMECALVKLESTRRDIWQDNIVYWLCRSVWLILDHILRG